MGDSTQRESIEPLFEAIAAHSTDSIMLLDRDARIRFINRTAPGLTVDEVLGTHVYEYVPPDQHDEMRRCFERVLETGESDRYENRYQVSETELTSWESRVGPIKKNDEITGFVVFASDVTERTTAAAERDRLFELSKDLLCIVSHDGYFTRVNPAFVETLGYSEEELLARPFAELLHPDDRAMTAEAYEGSKAGDVAVFENRYLRKDGKTVLLQWTSTPDEKAHRNIAVARDVTKQRALEEQLRQSQKMDAVGRLAGGVAHDFNNLLQAILGNVHFALGTDPGSEMRSYVEDIEAAAERASELTKQLLAFSRQQPLTTLVVDLNELIRELIQLLRRVIPADVEIDFIGGHQLDKIEADPSQLEQVMMNLCLNARDAMRSGGRVTIETENVLLNGGFTESHPWAKAGRYVLVSVSDTGTGMTPEVRDRVFEPFFTTKAPGEGTGLGLAVVYGIVEQHGGLIHVYSEVDEGTTLKIYFPVTLRMANDVGPKIAAAPAGGAETVLLAEDEPLVRRVVVKLLERAGYRVIAAENGAAALKHCRARDDIDIAILDVVMPDMSGPEAYERIREIRPELPAIFSSGYSDSSRFAHALPEGAALLEKPYKVEALLAAIRGALDSGADE